jgi:hypothetical protein
MDLNNPDDWFLFNLLFSDEEEQEESEMAAFTISLASYMMSNPSAVRDMNRQRTSWETFADKLENTDGTFGATFRMSRPAFDKLVALLHPALMPDILQSGNVCSSPILPELALAMTLRYLAGGSYLDIKEVYNVSKSSFYRSRDNVIEAILACNDLHFKFPQTRNEVEHQAAQFRALSSEDVMRGCVGALDGCLIPIDRPRWGHDQQINVMRYYSGHYERFGLNVQAVVNHRCQFLFFSVAAAGGTNDAAAYRLTSLPQLVGNLPSPFYIVADAAYPISEHLLVPFTGSQRMDLNKDAFNFFLSQLRIRVEQAFGLLTNKWRALRTPMTNSLSCNTRIITACSLLHNFVIAEDWPKDHDNLGRLNAEVSNIVPLDNAPNGEGYMPILQDLQDPDTPGVSVCRDHIVNYIQQNSLRRPQYNLHRNQDRNLEDEGLV